MAAQHTIVFMAQVSKRKCPKELVKHARKHDLLISARVGIQLGA